MSSEDTLNSHSGGHQGKKARRSLSILALLSTLTSSPQPLSPHQPYPEPSAHPGRSALAIESKPGSLIDFQDETHFLETVRQTNESADMENSWFCIGGKCLSFGEPTRYFGFTPQYGLLSDFIADQETSPESLTAALWVHNHPPAANYETAAQSSPTLQDFTVHLRLRKLLSEANTGAKLEGAVVTAFGNWKFFITNAAPIITLSDGSSQLKVDRFWLDRFERMRESKDTTPSQLSELLASVGIELTFTQTPPPESTLSPRFVSRD